MAKKSRGTGPYWKCKCCGTGKPSSKFPTPEQNVRLDRPGFLEEAERGEVARAAYSASLPDHKDDWSLMNRSTALVTARKVAAWRAQQEQR
jgi:hypothetical protein